MFILSINVISVEGNIGFSYKEGLWWNGGVAPLVYTSRKPHHKCTVKFTLGKCVKT